MVISNLLVYGGLYFVDDDGEKMEVVLCLLTLYIATDLLILSLFFFAFPFLFLLSCLIMKFQIYRLFFIKPYVHGLKVAFTVRMSNHFPWER